MRPKERIKPFLKIIEDYWKENQDLRFSQVLVNMGIVPNTLGHWYYKEEYETFPDPSIMFWGNRGKSGRAKLKYISIDKMNTDHIEACLKTQKYMSSAYRIAMEDELERRLKCQQ